MYFQSWLDKNSDCASYKHFDYKISLKDVIDNIKDEKYIETHSFKPFIRIVKNKIKYSKKTGKQTKPRQLNYASHYDRCIYQYYSYLINRKYNEYALKNEINENAIAYRDNLRKNNIHYSYKAFNFIKSNPGCIVFVGDFTNFFDNLDHCYLKEKLCGLINEKKMPLHLYKVFRSMTEYSFVNHSDILDILEKNKEDEEKERIISLKKLRENGKVIQKNKTGKGVPQGVALSSIFSNVYMIDFDKECKLLAEKYRGLYMRYSDDFIFVFPKQEIYSVNEFYKKIINKVNKIPQLLLSIEKTRIYYCDKGIVKSCEKEIGNKENSKNIIEYLGFAYDGNKVNIRDKTLSKYYYRMYNKVKTINLNRKKGLRGCGKKNLYLNYSNKGSNDKMNFFTYVNKCVNVFGKNERVHLLLNTHYGKIKKRLNYNLLKGG